jgi:hypothetical protein
MIIVWISRFRRDESGDSWKIACLWTNVQLGQWCIRQFEVGVCSDVIGAVTDQFLSCRRTWFLPIEGSLQHTIIPVVRSFAVSP